ncbi:MAG: hypothetical protein H7Z13_06855 [Ferruginibacter sp.]|nr:hypothetical protein [Ferruginibacter sp.]
MKNTISQLFNICFFLLVLSCNNETADVNNNENSNPHGPILAAKKPQYHLTGEWKKYWHDGNAEITTYRLKQSRYGEIHEGNFTNIFVTEDFSKLAQVKLDDPSAAGSDKISILKLNQAVKFVTGIYPYSLMLSVFSPVDINNYPHAIKITASAQEWCGIAFFQLNNRNNRYLIEQRSYFENESDQDISMEPVILEDECWNIIRMDPLELPQGDHLVLPGALYLRLSHKKISAVRAKLTLVTNDSNYIYTAAFASLNRRLNITIEKKFPYKILEWDDSFPGTDGKLLTSSATLNKTMRIAYWKKHNTTDKKIRAELGLPIDTQ